MPIVAEALRQKILKLLSKMSIHAGKNVRYAHFAEMCEKCDNMRNKPHIRIKLTCLRSALLLAVPLRTAIVHVECSGL